MRFLLFASLAVLISLAIAAPSDKFDEEADSRVKRGFPPLPPQKCYSKHDCGNRAQCKSGTCKCDPGTVGNAYVECRYTCLDPVRTLVKKFSYVKTPKGEYNIGDIITVECVKGYTTKDVKTVKCCLHGAGTEWRVKFPDCEPIQCLEPSPLNPNSYIIPSTKQDTYEYTDKITFKCDSGFRLEGVSTLSCEATSKWSNEIPSCTRIKCAEPSPLDVNSFISATFKKSYYLYQNTIELECKLGWVLVGEKSYTCQANGHWSGVAFASCKRRSCPFPTNLGPHAFIHHLRKKSGYVFEDHVLVQCDCNCLRTTYTCGPYGLWVGKLPDCTPPATKDCSYQLCGKLAHCGLSGISCKCNQGCIGNPIKGCQAPKY